MKLRLDGYIRVSRVGGCEGGGYISPRVQREAIESYAAELDGEVVAWHHDQDFSGGTVARPGFQAALERLRAGDSDGLVVMAIDRFARSTADGYAVISEITGRGQVFASRHERIDPHTPEGKFMLRSFLSNAELFLDQAKAKWWTAKTRAVARGAHIGPTPIGYERIPNGGERSGRLVPDPTYGPAITELFRRAGSAPPDAELARWMTDRAPREGGGPWQTSEIRRWLANRVYLGEVHYGELANTEAHDPLTDDETFNRAQRAPGAPRRANGRRFLLAGLPRCASCRYSMGGSNYGGGGHTPVYRCSRARAGGCPEASVITAQRLEDHVLGLVREHLRGLELEAADVGVDLATLDREVEDAEADVRSYGTNDEARKMIGDAAWTEHLAELAAGRDAKREARDRAYSDSKLAAVAQDVDDLDREAVSDLLRGMIRHVFVRRRPRGADVAERALVIWSDDPRVIDVPGPHRSGSFEPISW